MTKYIANRMVRRSAVHQLKKEGYSIIHAKDLGLIKDEDIAIFAKQRGMTIVTRNGRFIERIPTDVKDVRIVIIRETPSGHDAWYSALKRVLR